MMQQQDQALVASEECSMWGMQSAAQRRRLQNRLAQRNHRKRMREQQQQQQEQERNQDEGQREHGQQESGEHQEEERHEALGDAEQLCFDDFIDLMPGSCGSGSDLWSACGTETGTETGTGTRAGPLDTQNNGAAWAPTVAAPGLLPSPSPSQSSPSWACGRAAPPVQLSFRTHQTQAQARAGTAAKWTTALHIATRCGHDRLARVLLENGAAANQRDSNGQTALHVAARHGRERLARMLLEHGAEMDAVDGDGWTPLHRTAEAGDDSIARLLLAHDWGL